MKPKTFFSIFKKTTPAALLLALMAAGTTPSMANPNEEVEKAATKLCCAGYSFLNHAQVCKEDKKFLNDPTFKKAIEAFLTKSNRIPIPNSDKTIETPDYKEALNLFLRSTIENKNQCAAYAGLRLMNMGFTIYAPNKAFIKKFGVEDDFKIFYKTFVDSLRKNTGSCYAYLYSIRYYGDYAGLMDQALKIGEQGARVCKKETIPWLKKSFFINWQKIKAKSSMRRSKKP